MPARDLILPIHALRDADRLAGRPAVVVDLDGVAEDAGMPALPPLPVLAVGAPGHPLAAAFDAVPEPGIGVEAMLDGIVAAPAAAAVASTLLRATCGVDAATALHSESLAYGLLQGSAGHGDWLAGREAPAAAAPGSVHVARHGAVLAVTVDRPAALGAIDRAVRDGLHEAFALAAMDPDICTVRLRSIGRAFSIGGDLAEFGTTRDPATAHLIRLQTLPAWPLVIGRTAMAAHVQGPCIGAGLEIAAFAERITAGADAWFQLPELAMGLIPGAGGTVSVPRRIGRQRTAALLFSGRRIGARTALDWGLIDAIMDDPAADPG